MRPLIATYSARVYVALAAMGRCATSNDLLPEYPSHRSLLSSIARSSWRRPWSVATGIRAGAPDEPLPDDVRGLGGIDGGSWCYLRKRSSCGLVMNPGTQPIWQNLHERMGNGVVDESPESAGHGFAVHLLSNQSSVESTSTEVGRWSRRSALRRSISRVTAGGGVLEVGRTRRRRCPCERRSRDMRSWRRPSTEGRESSLSTPATPARDAVRGVEVEQERPSGDDVLSPGFGPVLRGFVRPGFHPRTEAATVSQATTAPGFTAPPSARRGGRAVARRWAGLSGLSR